MSKQKEFHGLSGKISGLAVKGMIQSVEQNMMAGATVSAAPSSQYEAELLQQVKQENQRSAASAHNYKWNG